MGGYTGARQGVALNTDERLRRKDFQIAGPPALRRNVIPLKHKTHSNRPYTHTLLIRSQGNMPGGVAAKHVMKHSNFTMKYPCVLPQTCRGARDVCAVAHAHSHFFLSFLHTQMYWKSQPSLQIWHIAEDIHRVCHTHACTHTYTWPFDFRVTLKEPF